MTISRAAMNFKKESLREETAQWVNYLPQKCEILSLASQNPRRVEFYSTYLDTLCALAERANRREHSNLASLVYTVANDKRSCLRQVENEEQDLRLSSIHTQYQVMSSPIHINMCILYTQTPKLKKETLIYQ